MSTLSTAECLAVALLAAAWVVPAWWLGTLTVGSQLYGAAAGAVALLFAGLARHAGPPSPPVHPPRILPLLSVVCLSAFLALLLCQALNPDRLLIPGPQVGTLQPLPHLAWLPTGLACPFDRLPGDTLLFTNAWRHLLVAAAVLLPLGALLVLPSRPPLVRALLGLLFLHAVLFSAFAFVHNLSGSRAVLWFVTDPNFHLGAPQFPFKNQQAAYQVLLFALTLSLRFAPPPLQPWPGLPGRNRWFAIGTAIVFFGTVTTRSRAGLLTAAVLVVVAVALALWPHRGEWRRHRRALAVSGIAALVALVTLVSLPPVRATLHRAVELARSPGDLLVGGSFRRILHDIAWEMTLDRPWFGHGAGCYLPLFPEYRPRVPAYLETVRREHPDTNRPVHTHADGDWIEFTAEYGFVGTALLAAPWLAWLAALHRLRPSAPAAILLAAGPVLVLVHGWIDFVLRNPAILALAAALAVLALRSAQGAAAPAPIRP